MKVEEFLRQYKFASKARESEEKFLQERMVRDYVPYVQKIAVCSRIIDACWYEKQGVDENGIVRTKRFRINSPNTYLLFILSLLKEYTDLELLEKGSDNAKDYDELNKAGMIGKMTSRIPMQEYNEFKMVFGMIESDRKSNEYEISSWLRNTINDITFLACNSLVPALENAGININQIKDIILSKE